MDKTSSHYQNRSWKLYPRCFFGKYYLLLYSGKWKFRLWGSWERPLEIRKRYECLHLGPVNPCKTSVDLQEHKPQGPHLHVVYHCGFALHWSHNRTGWQLSEVTDPHNQNNMCNLSHSPVPFGTWDHRPEDQQVVSVTRNALKVCLQQKWAFL